MVAMAKDDGSGVEGGKARTRSLFEGIRSCDMRLQCEQSAHRRGKIRVFEFSKPWMELGRRVTGLSSAPSRAFQVPTKDFSLSSYPYVRLVRLAAAAPRLATEPLYSGGWNQGVTGRKEMPSRRHRLEPFFFF